MTRSAMTYLGPAGGWPIAVVSVLACLIHAPLQAGPPKQLELTWNEVAPVVGRHKIRLVVPPGVRLEGKLESVRADTLVMHVKKSSDRQLFPKGYQKIPRSSVSVIQLVRKGRLWRIVGTSVGAVLGFASGATLAFLKSDWGHYDVWNAAASAILVGFPIGGYHPGNRLDRKVTQIVVVPDDRR